MPNPASHSQKAKGSPARQQELPSPGNRLSLFGTHLITAILNTGRGNVYPWKAQHRNLPLLQRDSSDMKHPNSASQSNGKATVRRFTDESPSEMRGMGKARRGHTFSELFETCCLQSPPRVCCQGLLSSAKTDSLSPQPLCHTHTHTHTHTPQPPRPPHI